MRMHLRGGLVALVLMASCGVAFALDPADQAATRSVIERQIDAFRRDAASEAFAFASPDLKTIFGSQDRFMEMVRSGYPPVYRPRSFEFGEIREAAGGVQRIVRIQDDKGVDWDALYSFEKQPDGSWLISGCQLVKRPGESV